MLRPRTPAEPLLAAATLGILASMVHSAVDFDWSHPAVLVQFAILAACRPALSHAAATGVVRAGRPPSRAAAAGAVALGAALAVSAGALHAWQHSERSAFTTTPVSEALAAAAAPFGDYRPAQMVLRTALAQPTAVPPGDVRRALAETGRAATVDVDLSLLRDAVAASYGLDPRAAVRAQALVDSLDGGPEPYVLGLATVYRSAGEAARGVELVRRQLAADAHLQVTDGQTPGELQFLAATAPGDYACLLPKLMALLGSGTPLPAADAPARGCAAVLRTGQASG
jgi:hypothetical protein